ncbi:phosphonatase-like hydrolase [Lysobacter enzymogenes]|uniref:HAD family hydrolase n=1 Tax=Lysobacter enzymogenes TaxID=69 RepID=UPI000898DDBA|nr:HAD family hydrolase [Lysobacter enzymogenes]SDW62858.1 phosphonatase-like hydrolase [Lysobacter enzymogenes]
MNYRLALFDIAGTTVSDPGFVAEAFVGAMTAAGHPIEAETCRALMGYRKPEAIARLLGEAATPAKIEAIHDDFVARMLRCYRERPGVAPLPGAESTFALLRAHGIKVALNTGFSRDIAEAIVTRLGWSGRIDALIASDEVPSGRPAPYMAQALLRRFGIDDARALVKIGDTEVDIGEGRNAGAGLVVAITTGAFRRDELEPYAPDAIVDSLFELPALLGIDASARDDAA